MVPLYFRVRPPTPRGTSNHGLDQNDSNIISKSLDWSTPQICRWWFPSRTAIKVPKTLVAFNNGLTGKNAPPTREKRFLSKPFSSISSFGKVLFWRSSDPPSFGKNLNYEYTDYRFESRRKIGAMLWKHDVVSRSENWSFDTTFESLMRASIVCLRVVLLRNGISLKLNNENRVTICITVKYFRCR